jgi:gentisate 1,2-dioxygenase
MSEAGSPTYESNVFFAQDEMERRSKSTLVRRGADIHRELEEIDYRNPVSVIDPSLGFQSRTLRCFVNRVAPAREQERSEGWKERKGAGGGTHLGHRHTVEAVIYFLQGKGYSVVNGVRYDWKAGDFICIPVFAWHRHVNTGDEPTVHLAVVSVPFHKAIGLSVFEDEQYPEQWIFASPESFSGESLVPGAADTGVADEEWQGNSLASEVYRREVEFAVAEEAERQHSEVLVRGEDLDFQPTPLGGETAYVVHPDLGFNARVLATYVQRLRQGEASARHRHMYEEAVYVLQGSGHSRIGDQEVTWGPGDVLFVPPLTWHEHHAGDEARLLTHTNYPLTRNIGLSITQHG